MKPIDLKTCSPALKARIEQALSGQRTHAEASGTAVNAPAAIEQTPKRATGAYKSKAEGVAAAHLNLLLRSGEVVVWRYEAFKVQIAPAGELRACGYTPDFVARRPDGDLLLIEVKGGGFCREKALVKLKVAAGVICPEWGWGMELWIVNGASVERRTIAGGGKS